MRLTLRTMLAFLDDVLEADDAREIGKKVQESQFASDLTHRIRGCVRRLRLPTPPLDGQGMGLDPNSVAEYLDSTLPDEQVPDFEKVCLDSDMQLAEVSSCHQILTLVLGEPAHVEPSTRERIYRMGTSETVEKGTDQSLSESAEVMGSSEHTRQSPSEVGVMETNDTAARTGSRQKPQIPGYLRDEPRRSWWPVIATFLFAGLVTIGLFRLAGPFDRTHPVFVALSQSNTEADSRDTTQRLVPPGEFEGDLDFDVETDEPLQSRQETDAASLELTPKEAIPAENVVPFSDPEATTVIKPNERPVTNAVIEDSSGEPAVVNRPEETTVAPTAALIGAGTEPDVHPLEPPADGETIVGMAAQDSTEPGISAPIDIGRFLSDEEVLIRRDAASGMWQRLPPQTPLFTGDTVTALPTYRPQFLLGAGVGNVKLFGSSRVNIEGSAESPRMDVQFGRLLLNSVGRTDARVTLGLFGRDVEILFLDAESVLAVEVLRQHSPGTDARKWHAHEIVRITPTTGSVEISETSFPTWKLNTGKSWVFVDDEAPEVHPIDEFPPWLEGGDLRDIDRIASQHIESSLSDQRSVELTLAELTESARLEVCTLAVRCLTYLDDFEPAIKALSDAEQRQWWQLHVTALQDALSRHPQTAQDMLSALQKHRGTDAELMLDLLSGFSPDDLQAGGAAALVGYLDHSKLDIRVLANENLRMITGTRPIYNPGDTPAKRKGAIRRWQLKLEQGKVVYKQPPLEIRPSRSLLEPAELSDEGEASLIDEGSDESVSENTL